MPQHNAHARQAKQQTTTSALSSSPGITKPKLNQHKSQKAKQQPAAHCKEVQSSFESAESDTASTNTAPQPMDSQEVMQHVAGGLHSSCKAVAAQALQLQLPKTGLTMAMTCCDMDDQLQDVNFVPSSSNCTPSDFVLFSTTTEHRLSLPVQAKTVQNDFFQTASQPTDLSAKLLQLSEPRCSSSVVITANCAQTVPTKPTPVRSNTACAAPGVKCVAPEVKQPQPPAAPRRSLPQNVFAPPDKLVCANSPLPTALPRPATKQRSLLCNPVRQLEAEDSSTTQHLLHTLTSAYEAHVVRGSGQTPITCANELLQKLLMYKTGSCRE